jgi:hypothetical protein
MPAVFLLIGMLTGCGATQPQIPDSAAVGRVNADQLMPVDCLLPAQMRKLGTSMTYLAPRRAIKTTAIDCEIRGGEYVAYDRADYRTSLNVWLEKAKQGDPEAQTYVGEIYEKGLGLPSDYNTARSWYAKAAEQGYARAQINLGYLYEKGLGVAQDRIAALNWYRRASGVTDDDIDYASAIEVKAATLAEEKTQVLRQEVERREREIGELRSSLSAAQKRLQRQESELQDAKRRLQKLRQQIQQTTDSVQLGSLQQAYAAEQARVAQLEIQVVDLQAEAEQNRQSLQRESSAVKTQKERLAQQQISGPSIEVFDPAVAITRSGEPSVRVRAGSKARLISGRIDAPAGLRSATINGNPITPDSSGLFNTAISVAETEKRVVIQVNDRLGKQAEFSFMLIPERRQVKTRFDESQMSRVAGSIDFGRYYALVIGNDEYQNFPPLTTAINDARQVAEVLREKYGFNTRFVSNADRYTILSALNEVKSKLGERDNLLIYYAGHGERDIGTLQGYWLPVDAEQENSANWIPNSAISDLLNTMQARHILVIADSCYSGSMTRSSVARLDTELSDENLKKWLKVMARTRSRTVLTSGGVAPVLDTGGGQHSVFARAFLEELEQASGPIDAYKIYLRVTRQVQQAAAQVGFNQTPTYAPIKFTGHSGGEFIFVKG